MSGTDLPPQEISDEMVREFNRAFNEACDHPDGMGPNDAARAGLAAALAASEWRPPQEISDEDAVELLARRAWRRRHSITWESGADEDRQGFLTAARLDLAALVASGYRREEEVRAEIATTLRSAAAGRREYADGMPRGAAWEPSVELLNMQATTLESAALVAEGNLEPLYNWLPSRRWTDEMMANLYREQATALEQAQPLLVAGECVSGRRADGVPLPPMCCGGWADRNGGAATLCDPCPPEGQERSEEKSHG
jgi:hypothetical protein